MGELIHLDQKRSSLKLLKPTSNGVEKLYQFHIDTKTSPLVLEGTREVFEELIIHILEVMDEIDGK